VLPVCRHGIRDASGSSRLYLARQLAQNEAFEVDFAAGVVDVNASQVAAAIVIKDHAHRDLTTLGCSDTQLKTVTAATDGNLGAHIGILEQAGYLTVEKDFVGKKPRTRMQITKAGRRAFERYVEFLRTIVDAS
jgi:hypothetical protein